MQIVLRPNIKLSKNKDRNLTDRRPLKGETLERKGIGPVKKNFDIPKALENIDILLDLSKRLGRS